MREKLAEAQVERDALVLLPSPLEELPKASHYK